MNYQQWRDQLFGQPARANPIFTELSPEIYTMPRHQAFDFIDRLLLDSEIHQKASPAQIGFGLNYIFSNSCSDFPLCYLESPEPRIVQGVKNLKYLYRHYFDRYCFVSDKSIQVIGSTPKGDRLSYLCYMFWDLFVLHPGYTAPSVIQAGLEVMSEALYSKNGNAIVSAIHGLGHWSLNNKQAVAILEKWLKHPSTQNSVIRSYAQQAKTGYIQ
jgi:hypothetical protein